MENVILFLLCLPGLLYACWIVILIRGVNREEHRKAKGNPEVSEIFTSVIIAARNESAHILNILNDLYLQDAGFNHFEVILVDDHSEDQTASLAKAFSDKHPEMQMKILKLEGEQESTKKAALELALKHASGSHILRTDADCRLPVSWISAYSEEFAGGGFLLIAGLVVIRKDSSIFSRLQSLEFMSLSAAGVAMAGLGKPVYANAANLGHLRDATDAYAPEKLKQLASGDDVTVLLSVAKTYPARIKYLLNKQTRVETQACTKLKDFIQQRIRWAGKSRHNYNAMNTITAIWVLLYSLMMLIWPVLSLINGRYVIAAAWIVLVKFVTDFIFLRIFAAKTTQWFLIRDYVLLSIIYPIYVIIIAISSLKGGYEWKNRRYVGQ